MLYSDARPHISSGDLLAWSANKLGSIKDLQVQAIRVFDRTEYTHVGLAWVVAGRVFVIEAVTPYVRIVPLSHELPCYHIATNIEWTEDLEAYALSFVGNDAYRYSKLEAIKAFFGLNNKSNGQIECAEFIQLVYDKANIHLTGRATPSDVVEDLLKSSFTLQFIS